jgi:hypothetical protein
VAPVTVPVTANGIDNEPYIVACGTVKMEFKSGTPEDEESWHIEGA